ncbi:hypothetical protein M0802_006028 [Mischocyttarus mexicanus]|nr:hypothetical protein M0802_006028 [Mischocyttarus mexicanus]
MEQSDQSKYINILYTLTINKIVDDFENKLKEIVDKTLFLLSEDDKYAIFGENKCPNNYSDIRYQYIQIVTYVLKKIQTIEETNDYLNVKTYKLFKTAIELIVSIGIIQCLLPGIGVDMKKLCPRALKLTEDKTTILQKYERLCLSSCSLIEYYNGSFLRPAVISHIGPLIAALLQLSYAPLKKPNEEELSSKDEKETTSEKEFVMTVNLYKKLQYDKKKFLSELERLFDNCPQYLIMKELMIILGNKEAPLWIRKITRQHLINKIQQPNGVVSLVNTLYDDTMLDLGTDWNKLDVIVRLISTSHETDKNKYYEAICPQLLELITLKNHNNYSIIANNCMIALYESSPNICKKNIIDVIMKPLITNLDHEVNESELNKCIENLLTCFTPIETQFKTLPIKLMSIIAIPLFSIHNKVRSSACFLRNKVRQLLLLLLQEDNLQNDLFSAFLGYNTKDNFGKFVSIKFGSNGGIEIIGIEKNLPYEELADSLFDLISLDKVLTTNLFSYLLKLLPNFTTKLTCDNNMLETSYDVMERVEKQLIIIKLLSNLATKSVVQEAQLKNPESLLNFIKSLLDEKIIEKSKNNTEDDDNEIIYISLMLIKMILSSNDKKLNRTSFVSFAKYLKEGINKNSSTMMMSSQLVALIKEIICLIERKQSDQTYYEDLSVDNKRLNTFEEAIKDLSDPLLPVRAHGIITLTKLIETKDQFAVARKTIILRLFQENLKHEDSFIYLAAINGMCALAVLYPKEIIEILVQEYIFMPQRIEICETTIQSRIKLGEILVRTTRGLGKIAYVYKNILVNGFLCGVRDTDPLIRASSLSCLGELCKVLGFRLGNLMVEIIYCIKCIITTDKIPECRRAAVLVITLLLRGSEKDALIKLSEYLSDLHRILIHLRDNDKDPVLRLHAQLALEEINKIVSDYIFAKPKLGNNIFSSLE